MENVARKLAGGETFYSSWCDVAAPNTCLCDVAPRVNLVLSGASCLCFIASVTLVLLQVMFIDTHPPVHTQPTLSHECGWRGCVYIALSYISCVDYVSDSGLFRDFPCTTVPTLIQMFHSVTPLSHRRLITNLFSLLSTGCLHIQRFFHRCFIPGWAETSLTWG